MPACAVDEIDLRRGDLVRYRARPFLEKDGQIGATLSDGEIAGRTASKLVALTSLAAIEQELARRSTKPSSLSQKGSRKRETARRG